MGFLVGASLSEHEQYEAPGQHGAPRMWVFRCGGRRWAEVRGHQEHPVCLLIQCHSARTRLGGHILEDAEAVGTLLLDHRQGPLAVRAEGPLRAWIESRRVYTASNGQ